MDASASMGNLVPGRGGQTRMDLAKNSLLQALATFTPEDEIGLWKFATLRDGDKDYLYGTTLAAYEKARSTYASGKFNALVIVADGANDDIGGIGLDALVAKVKKLSDPARPVPLIAVAIGPEADESALDRIVAPAGGSAHRVDDPAQIHQVILKTIMAAGSETQPR